MIRILLKTIFLFMPGMIWGSCSSGEKAETAAGLTLQRVTTYTLAASGGQGLLVYHACMKAREGATLE